MKTVPWAQKVNFRQKKYKESERKNTFSPLTKKIIKISKNKKYRFKNFTQQPFMPNFIIVALLM